MKVKIFGERNTSTNALKQIIEKNSDSFCWPGTMLELDARAAKRVDMMRKFRLPKRILEASIDGVFRDRALTEQWKHTSTDFADIVDFRDTCVIFTVRHPLSWLLSLYKNPYHALINLPPTLEGFLNSKWKTVGRERLGGKSFKPLELYETKVRSYKNLTRKFEDANISTSMLKFEDLVTNQQGAFEKVASCLDNPTQEFVPLIRSTKSRDKDLSYYIDYYGQEKWKKEISGAVLESFVFDTDLMNWMGYK